MSHTLSRLLCIMAVASALTFIPPASAQTASAPGSPASPVVDPNAQLSNHLLTVRLGDYSMSGLVTHLPEAKNFKHGIVLFPGHPSIMRLREENGVIRFDLGGNFLIRSRRHWLDEETLVLSVDAPSDQWASFSQHFRYTQRYGNDIAALLNEAEKQYAIKDWTFSGTSEGAVSAFHTARMNPALATRMILSSSLFLSTRNGPGMTGVDWNDIKAKLLWVHHEHDGCQYTPYREAQRHAEMTRSPLITVRGGGPFRGHPCEAYSQHGFVGLERETVLAMREWVKSGTVKAELGQP